MKKTIKVTIALLLFTNSAIAQLPVLSQTSLANSTDDFNITDNGNYAVDTANERDQYVGTWEYNENGVLFQIKMEKIDQYLNKIEDNNGMVHSYTYADVIRFKYKLVKNGTTIYDNLSQTVFPVGTYIPTAIKKSSADDLYGSFFDATRNAIPIVSIIRLSTTPAKIIFKVFKGGTLLENPREYYDDGQPMLSIPSGEIEMIKID